MKHLILLLNICLSLTTLAQNTGAHQHQPPPQLTQPFLRGMFVDCTNEIITDIHSGNPLGKFQELKQYIRDNFISFIALKGLDRNAVIGNSILEPTLRFFLSDLRQNFPNLRIAAVGSSQGFFNASGFLRVNDYFNRNCFPGAYGLTIAQTDSIINNVSTPSNLKRSEVCKFFLRAATINRCRNERVSDRCKAAFDVLFLDYPYWENAGITTLTDMQMEFENYKSILKVMQMLKCNFSCISSVESEFSPTDYYRLSGWTATDQITEADPLIDRMLIPAHSSDQANAFDLSCRNLHLLSDRFTKNGTRFYIGLSASSSAYSYCDSPDLPPDHLGSYLDGSGISSGNMYSVEKNFTDKLLNPSYFCSDCSCYAFNDNQYSSSNLPANQCAGVVWYTYSMMQDHLITRQVADSGPILKTGIVDTRIEIALSGDEYISEILLLDIHGKIVRAKENMNASSTDISIEGIPSGVYLLRIITNTSRTFNRYQPVLYR